ncbi:MAG: helix-turn-helix domain-containing protein [Phycisphaerae bacterium]|jgi:transcriptional regulator with XRE-family HTH domain
MQQAEYGKKIRLFRKKAGLGLRNLANLAGLSPAAISAIEHDRSSPTLATLHKILKALNTDFADFFSSYQTLDHTPVFAHEDMTAISDKCRKYTLVFPKREDIQFEISMETITSFEDECEWEVHDCDVGGVVLSSKHAKIEVEGQGEWPLAQGDAFYIKAGCKHRLVNLERAAMNLITVYYPANY